ncbi:MAG: prepilin-type N-terminal cleavage/methylation domain-containing protein [Phycisphaeraceae bacterium]|nr:prepilin-type N-terminal cleavage/methylation domain-containing protein [Phycisphaeraceae bacterium]
MTNRPVHSDADAQLRADALRKGFTLTELLVAIVVLLVIILAVGRIFGTASTVVKNGEANADILQETAAVEQLIRNDLARISDEGFMIIQCIGVRNDVNTVVNGGPLLDPTKPAGHIFRADQLAFVADDLAISRQTQTMGAFIENANGFYTGETSPTPQSTSSIVYYGHGVQFPFLPKNLGVTADVDPSYNIQPWFRPSPADTSARVELQRWPQGTALPGQYNGSQPDATDWTLARQETLMADDGQGNLRNFLTTPANRNSAEAIFDDAMEASRVDVVATDVGRLRESIRNLGPDGVVNTLLNYRPRAEKRPPTLDKSDVLLTTSVLAGNCSNFVIDWTWSDGVGRELELDFDPQSNFAGILRGVSHRGGFRPGVGNEPAEVVEASLPQPWFGFADNSSDSGNPNLDVTFASAYLGGSFYDRAVRLHAPLAYHPANQILGGQQPPSFDFFPDSTVESFVPQAVSTIEGIGGAGGSVVDQPFGSSVPVYRYRAFFGLNGKEPFVRDGSGRPITAAAAGGDPWPVYRTDYTPWPSALRITATFHDNRDAIEGGRLVQFTIPLPKRVQDLPED